MLDMLKSLNLTPEQMEQLQTAMAGAKDNPMAAMAAITEILPQETIQQLMMMFMQNPEAVMNMAKEAGVSDEQIEEVKNNFS